MKLEDYLEKSNLDEAKKKHPDKDITTAFGTGYFVDPSGKLHVIGKAITHEEWANNQNNTVNDLLDRGWTRIRNFGPSINYVQGDSNKLNNIWYLIELADKMNETKIVYTHNKNRIELVKKDNRWETIDGKEIGDITEGRLRISPPVVT